jgi:transcriptional regulator with XRE-family HTH domain
MPKLPPARVLGERIREERVLRAMTQLELANKAGLPGPNAAAWVCRFETGQRDPRFSTIKKLAEALGMTVSDLLR